MGMKKVIMEMIENIPGGKSAVAGFLGFSEAELNNRLYQTKGQRFKNEELIALQLEYVTSRARDVYLTEENTQVAEHGQEVRIFYKPVLLQKGAAKIYDWYMKNQLPMKANWNGNFKQDKTVA